jgi:hypothetical protein
MLVFVNINAIFVTSGICMSYIQSARVGDKYLSVPELLKFLVMPSCPPPLRVNVGN